MFFLKSIVFRRRRTEGQGARFPASRRASVIHRARGHTGRLQNCQIISDSLKSLRYGMRPPARPPHEIRIVQQVGMVGVLHTKVDKEGQNQQESPMSLTGPEVELRSEGPLTRNVTGVDAECRRQPVSSPSTHIHPSATFEYAVGKGVRLSAEVTPVTIRKGNPIETLISGQYVMAYRIPCGWNGSRDPGRMQGLPFT